MKAALQRHVGSLVIVLSVLTGVISPHSAAVEIAATGLSIPFFNEAGKPTHKLIARRGAMVGTMQHLQEIEVVYYADHDPGRIVQRLRTAEATWDEQKEVLAGRGEIVVETEENRLSGTGFYFALATSRLNLNRDFAMTNPDLRLTSDRAVVDLIVDRAGEAVKVRDIRRCEAIGNLHVTVLPTARKTYRFNEAFSDRAIYDGATHTITLPNRVRFLRNGRETTSDSFEIILDDKDRPFTKQPANEGTRVRQE